MVARLTQAHLDHARASHEQNVHREEIKIIFECAFHINRKT